MAVAKTSIAAERHMVIVRDQLTHRHICITRFSRLTLQIPISHMLFFKAQKNFPVAMSATH